MPQPARKIAHFLSPAVLEEEPPFHAICSAISEREPSILHADLHSSVWSEVKDDLEALSSQSEMPLTIAAVANVTNLYNEKSCANAIDSSSSRQTWKQPNSARLISTVA